MDAPHILAPDPNKQPKLSARTSLYFKGAVVLFLVIFTTIIAACGAPDNSMSATEKPQVTVTIDPNHIQKQVTASPTPGYWCGAWATQTSPAYNADAQQMTLGINAKFTKNSGGNPQGVAGATASAIIHWGDGSASNASGTTSSDGLVVIPISTAGHEGAVGRTSIVTLDFAGPDGSHCSVGQDRAAFFSLTKPTVTPSPSPTQPNNSGGPGGQPTGIPRFCPTITLPNVTPPACP